MRISYSYSINYLKEAFKAYPALCAAMSGGTAVNQITVKAYGKLNLGLEILGPGFSGATHDLRMVMQSSRGSV